MMALAIRMPPEPVRFVRRFMGVTGVLSAICGSCWIALAVWRAISEAAVVLPQPWRAIFALLFLLTMVMNGVSWIMLAASRFLWSRKAE